MTETPGANTSIGGFLSKILLVYHKLANANSGDTQAIADNPRATVTEKKKKLVALIGDDSPTNIHCTGQRYDVEQRLEYGKVVYLLDTHYVVPTQGTVIIPNGEFYKAETAKILKNCNYRIGSIGKGLSQAKKIVKYGPLDLIVLGTKLSPRKGAEPTEDTVIQLLKHIKKYQSDTGIILMHINPEIPGIEPSNNFKMENISQQFPDLKIQQIYKPFDGNMFLQILNSFDFYQRTN